MDTRRPQSAGVGGVRAIRARDEGAFTLVELLVVMLILSTLAAISIPAFFSQREKARDAEAKAHLSVAQRSIETYAVDNGGRYTGATEATLVSIEGALTGASLTVISTGPRTYELRMISAAGGSFFLVRAADGSLSRNCDLPGQGGCPVAGTW